RNIFQVLIHNGLVQVALSNPEGHVIGIKYNGIDNVLQETSHVKNDGGYWDVVWYKPGAKGRTDRLSGTNFTIITQDENLVEVSFSSIWQPSYSGNQVPLNVDKRYIVRRGISGIYMYAILERQVGWPDVDMDQLRIAFKLNEDKFHYMAISDDRQRIMPTPQDRADGKVLAYPEAVLLTNPSNSQLKGQVDDKYQYSCDDEDNRVHGWISSNHGVGFWMITPSDEFRAGGPMKADLTSHVGPTTLCMFHSTHYTGKDIDTSYRNGEPWKKVFGPVFVYLNSISPQQHRLTLWEDAKTQMLREVQNWPYDFPKSNDFPYKNQRGTVSGKLFVHDRYINVTPMWARNAYVGLAPPGEAGSWQLDTKGYQFWTRADDTGSFVITNVRAGNYSIYAWVPGFMGDYKYNLVITIKPGSVIKLNNLVYEPPRSGPTLWEIGRPDRTAAEFFIPDPYASLTSNLYKNNKNQEKFRQYGLWERYADIYPHDDLVFTAGVSDYSQDWFFAHVTRNTGNLTYQATTWRIIFNLQDVNNTGSYTLQLALASASYSEVQVRFNDEKIFPAHFSTRLIGKDNAIARHGIHGLYRFYSINVLGNQLHSGNNTIYLTQSRSQGPFQGVMYDYIRLEGPEST
ncbi:Rhamnogal_lyase domain-containing protein, partial [Cephalotus follicularis]